MALTQEELARCVFIKITTASLLPQFAENSPAVFAAGTDRLRALANGDGNEAFHQGRHAELARITSVTLGSIRQAPDGTLVYPSHTYTDRDEGRLLALVGNALILRRERGIFQLAGYGVRGFDIPFLTKRFWIHGMALPLCLHLQGRKPWDPGVVDLADVWSNAEWRQTVPFPLFCHALNPVLAQTLTPRLAEHTAALWATAEADPENGAPLGELSHACSLELLATMQVGWQLAAVTA